MKIKLPDPAPVTLAGVHAPEIELCLKESETSGSQSIGGGDFSSSNSSLSLRHSPIMWRRRLKEEAAAAAAAAAAAEKRRKQEVAGSSPGEVICFQILTSEMGSPAPVGGAGACLVAPKWFCLRYLVRVFFLSHKFPHRCQRCGVLVIPSRGGRHTPREETPTTPRDHTEKNCVFNLWLKKNTLTKYRKHN